MNIIRSGKLKRYTCTHCSSELEVAAEDIKTCEIGHPFGAWFVCPVCGQSNPMDGKIPKEWAHIVYKDEPI